jgi:hypothetical protein
VVRGHGLTLSSEVAVLSAVPVPSAPTQAGGGERDGGDHEAWLQARRLQEARAGMVSSGPFLSFFLHSSPQVS